MKLNLLIKFLKTYFNMSIRENALIRIVQGVDRIIISLDHFYTGDDRMFI